MDTTINSRLYDPSDGVRPCPLCGSGDHRAIEDYSLSPWQIVECAECGFVCLHNPVSYDSLVEDVAWEKTFETEKTRRRKTRPVVDWISRSTRWRLSLFSSSKGSRFLRVFGQGKVLDVGCGSGTSLPEPLVPYGVEISKALATRADAAMKARGGRCIQSDAIGGVDSFPDAYFDGVLLHSFLEHENNPLPLLQAVSRVLRSDGSVYVRVPNYGSLNRRVMGRKWCGFRYPDHVNYFTPRTLRMMAEKAGFRMTILNRLTLPFDDNIKAVLSFPK